MTSELERNLENARARVQHALAALRGKHKGNEMAEYHVAAEQLLDAERRLAMARNEECAIPCEGFPVWDIGAPLPHVLYGLSGIILVYFVNEPDPNWDGQSVRVVDVADETIASVAVVRFHHPTSVRVGAPNDEVIHGHPLHGKGLTPYGAHVVMSSRWIAELQSTNAVHSQYDPARWTRRKHYLLAFHDETVECVAEGFTADVKRTTFAKACREALDEVMGT